MTYVLDACALIAYLRDEPGAPLVEAILRDENNGCYVHVVNLCEVYYDFHRRSGEDEARKACDGLREMRLSFRDDLLPEFWWKVGKLKAEQRRVSLADCFAITLAQELGASVLTSDHHEFDAVAKANLCPVAFIR